MSGIVGYFDPQQQLPKASLNLMRNALNPIHKNDRIVLDEDWAAVSVSNFNKLSSVINQSDYSLALLGEIETKEEVKSKYKALFNLEEKALSKMYGSFLAIRINKQRKQLHLITDHFGGYPCYIARYKNATLFATQLKSILSVLPSVSLDKNSIAMMLSIGEVVGNRTLVNEVTTLPAASITCIEADKETTQSIYWYYLHEQNFSANRENLIDEVGVALTKSVERQTQSYSHACIPLSGGLDSRFLLGLANQQGLGIDAYTWGTPDCRDLRYAKQVTEITNIPHQTYTFDSNYLKLLANEGLWLTEGHAPVTNFHVLPYINEVNKNGQNVLLDGFAGDVTLGGNFISRQWLNNSNFDDASQHLWQWRHDGFAPFSLKTSLGEFHQLSKSEFSSMNQKYDGETSMDKSMAFLLDNRIRRITACGTEIFRSKVIVKQPFMDIDVINAVRQIPHKWRIRHRFYVDVMNKFTPDVASAPWQRTALPVSFPYWLSYCSLAVQRGVSKIEPLSHLLAGKDPSQFDVWFRESLKSYTEEILFSDKTIDRKVLPMDALKEAWALHQEGKINASSFIGSALTIELFARLFIDDLDSSIKKYSK